MSVESSTPRSRHTKKASVIGRTHSHSTGHKEETHSTRHKEGARATGRKEGARSTGHKEESRVTLSRSLTPLEEVLAANLGTTFSITSAGKDVGVVDGQGLSVFLTQDEGG